MRTERYRIFLVHGTRVSALATEAHRCCFVEGEDSCEPNHVSTHPSSNSKASSLDDIRIEAVKSRRDSLLSTE